MITLICGRPRAGKTTYSKSYSNVIHLDDANVISLKERYDWVLDRIYGMKGDIVIDGIYSTPEQRKNYCILILEQDPSVFGLIQI